MFSTFSHYRPRVNNYFHCLICFLKQLLKLISQSGTDGSKGKCFDDDDNDEDNSISMALYGF